MNRSILIIEDDPFTQDFYKFIFGKVGYKTVILEDGDLIIERLGKEKYDLIIMDINLKNTYFRSKKIDGAKLSRYIKLNPALSRIPIILVTAYSATVKGNEFFEESLAEDFISKPIIDFNLLLNKVNNLIVN